MLPARVVEKAMGICRFMKLYGQHLPLAFEALLSMSCTVARLEGTLKGSNARASNGSNARASNGSNARASVLYVGRRKNYSYLRRTIFDDCQVVDERRTSLFAYRKHTDEMAASADVLLLDIGWPYHGRINRAGEYLEIPDWVNMAVELPDTWEAVVRSFRQTTRNNDLRLIRRNGYRCRPTTSREVLEDFYDRFYVPFVNHKHGGDSVIAPRKHVLKRGAQGALLQVLKDEEVVAAGVVYPEGEALFFLWMGLPPQYIDSPPEAAISALYFFGIRYAFDHDYKVVDFTGNRAFLDDGAFRFKRKWGARVEDSFSPGSILIKPTRSSRSAARFCQRFPVLARRGDCLEARFLFADKSASEADLARLRKDYDCEGIDRTIVIEISEETETKSMPILDDECQYRWIKTTLDEFAECYIRD
jgi:hypothetical protein